jgi:GNAT superfamily N-acetyltransferase
MIRIIQIHDRLPNLAALVAESRAAGFRHLVRLRDEWDAGTNRFDREGEAFFVAEVDGRVAGVCGLNRNPFDPASPVGRVRRLYVAEAYRRTGVATALLRKVIAAAEGHFRELTLRTDNPQADAFYRAMGFQRVEEPRATHKLSLANPPR